MVLMSHSALFMKVELFFWCFIIECSRTRTRHMPCLTFGYLCFSHALHLSMSPLPAQRLRLPSDLSFIDINISISLIIYTTIQTIVATTHTHHTVHPMSPAAPHCVLFASIFPKAFAKGMWKTLFIGDHLFFEHYLAWPSSSAHTSIITRTSSSTWL